VAGSQAPARNGNTTWAGVALARMAMPATSRWRSTSGFAVSLLGLFGLNPSDRSRLGLSRTEPAEASPWDEL
jgi:hypothetical protein